MSPRLFGIETEYGIAREDVEKMDPVVESMELVRAYLTVGFEQTWDYLAEDPHEDARGFRVQSLQQDKEEEEFAAREGGRPFSFHEMKSDLVLPNGARFYNDHTHPEYSSAECRTLRDVVAQDRAGERIVQMAADRRNRVLGGSPIQLYKNNTDFHGHSYGCHDNYLVPRAISFSKLAAGLMPFLVSRQLIAGAGKVGHESQGGLLRTGGYQLSQRADFMECEMSVDTMHNRPILNTRDEPHADRSRYRRLHLILGDANMCEYATALKIGITRLALDLIAEDAHPAIVLADPVAAIKVLSQDPDLKAVIECDDGRRLSGLDIQVLYLEAAKSRLAGTDAETDWILQEWEDTLVALGQDRARLVGRLDWITKLWLLETFVQEERIGWDDPWLASLDLEYHNVNPARGLFLGLEAEGRTRRVIGEQDIVQAVLAGPADTRGGIRGLCVARFRDQIKSLQWERIYFKGWLTPEVMDMSDLFDPGPVQALYRLLDEGPTPADALKRWRDVKHSHM
jgi:proteasome accessory factor A